MLRSAGVAPAEDDVHGSAGRPGGRVGHRGADGDVGQAVVVDVVAGDAVAEHLARVPGDAEGRVREVERRRRGRQRASVAEEDVDDARIGAADIGRGQADGVVAVAVAVRVAQLGDRRERAVAARHAEGRQRCRRQRSVADRAREQDEAGDRRHQRERRARLSQKTPAQPAGAEATACGQAGHRRGCRPPDVNPSLDSHYVRSNPLPPEYRRTPYRLWGRGAKHHEPPTGQALPERGGPARTLR